MRFMLAAAKGRWFAGNYTASYLGLFLTFGLMGLWHGTEPYYLLYGLYHGALSVGHDLFTRWNKTRRVWGAAVQRGAWRAQSSPSTRFAWGSCSFLEGSVRHGRRRLPSRLSQGTAPARVALRSKAPRGPSAPLRAPAGRPVVSSWNEPSRQVIRAARRPAAVTTICPTSVMEYPFDDDF